MRHYVTGSCRKHRLREALRNGVLAERPAQSGRIAGGRVGRFACGFHSVEVLCSTTKRVEAVVHGRDIIMPACGGSSFMGEGGLGGSYAA